MLYSPRSLLDESDNGDFFLPLLLGGSVYTKPPINSYKTLKFITFCEIGQFINQSFSPIYDGSNLKSQAVLDVEGKNLESLTSSTPGHMYCIK